ncbi:MAG: DUF3536 domain-containing protein [Deltaproteobacteria bacterium]|nr:DUF3536 domain-containing protein [Deltaproteobacteria bacterium]
MEEKYVCIHGHFYQPPRENPWLEEIELQDSAYPYHDWNERITAECYQPNASARILGPDSKIIDIVNNYSRISFNFGPTLLQDLERRRPDIHNAIVEADKASCMRFSGHGSAIAQIYNHMIMPLASVRDKKTMIRWGIRDFQKRFGRDPEGMWLPETAADTETLDLIAEEGIKFTILAPRQAKRVKKLAKGMRWKDVDEGGVDPGVPYTMSLPSGRTIAIFFYFGDIAHEVSFGGLLYNGEAFARKLSSPAYQDQVSLISIATDGETFGHHHKYGEMALAYCLYFIESQNLAKLTNFGEFLKMHTPDHLVEIHENSSWSCAHGVERWRSDCGCSTGMHGEWQQAWRAPLREGLDWVRDRLSALYEEEASKYLKDPWKARDSYIDVILDRGRENVDEFLLSHASKALGADDKVAVLNLLEMQRNALLMYTSCGWFFDEVSGIETVQILQYAARAIELAEAARGVPLEAEFLSYLEKAPSNVHGSGRKAYEMFVKPASIDLERVGMHFAISSLFRDYQKSTPVYCYSVDSLIYEKFEAGKLRLAIGMSDVSSNITREEAKLFFAAIHLGENNINGGISAYPGKSSYNLMREKMLLAFERRDIPEIIRLMDKYFGINNYSLWHLFRDEQRKVINQILLPTYEGIESSYRHIFDDNFNMMDFLRRLNIPLPRPLEATAEFTINTDLCRNLQGEVDVDELEALIKKAGSLSIRIDTDTIGFIAAAWLNSSMKTLNERPEDTALMEKVKNVLRLLSVFHPQMNLLIAQNAYFTIGRALLGNMKIRAETGDAAAGRWLAIFYELGDYFHARI